MLLLQKTENLLKPPCSQRAIRASPAAQWERTRLPRQDTEETRVPSLSREGPLEEGMAAHCGTLPWSIPSTEEPGGLQSAGSQGVRHDSGTKEQRDAHLGDGASGSQSGRLPSLSTLPSREPLCSLKAGKYSARKNLLQFISFSK